MPVKACEEAADRTVAVVEAETQRLVHGQLRHGGARLGADAVRAPGRID